MIKQVLYPVFDRAHGINVAGKASPAHVVPNKYKDDDHLAFVEWEFSEDMIDRIERKWQLKGYKSHRTVADNDPVEPGLTERQRRINFYASQYKYIIALSVHANAITKGDEWQDKATGIAYFSCKGETYSDSMVTRLHTLSEVKLPGIYHYNHFPKNSKHKGMQANFAVLMCKGYGVLVEIGFQDNKKDVAWLKEESTRELISDMIIEWLENENKLLIEKENGKK